jgi:calcineurin-like phosphoesterase family protein
MRYVISDLHLGHDNIIEYCDRPHSHVHEMNKALIEDWNAIISEDDSVLFLGDMCHHPSPKSSAGWADELNGNLLFVRGNHDSDVGHNPPFNVVENCTIQHGRYTFYCEHQPVDAPGWQIHGHTHNNDLAKYPFVDSVTQRVNVSVELLNYAPFRMDDLVSILDRNKSYRTLNDALQETTDDIPSWHDQR